jgi:hypothetical protein
LEKQQRLVVSMSNRVMTMDAVEHILTFNCGQHRMYKIFVAVEASILCDSPIAWLDLDRLVKSAGGEGPRVQRSVIRFGEPFADKRVVRQVAIVAGRYTVMTGLLPGIKMSLHDVAVGTGVRVVGKIR